MIISHQHRFIFAAIPKTGTSARLQENAAAASQALFADQLRELDTLFPPPRGPRPLAML